jgi:hypothetical protein
MAILVYQMVNIIELDLLKTLLGIFLGKKPMYFGIIGG